FSDVSGDFRLSDGFGTGVVGSGNQYALAYYPATGTTVQGMDRGTANQVLHSNGSSAAPDWGALDLTGTNTSLSGQLNTGNYSAYSDLGAEGYLGNAAGDLALNNGTLQSTLNADLLDGQHGSFYQNAGNINAGTLGNGYFSAYSDLGAEGYLNNDAGTDLLTRDQADARYMSGTEDQWVDETGDNMTGTLNIDVATGYAITVADQIQSTVASGTAPFVVASNTVVTNLNADRLDGLHESAFGRLSQNETIAGNWVNTANPWGTDEIVSSVMVEGENISLLNNDAGYITTWSETDPVWIAAEPSYGNLNQNETIAGNWVNTANPWADNEVADNLTISGGSVNNNSFSAYSDLTAEGYLNNDAGTDLLTRNQADTRYMSGTEDQWVNETGDNMTGQLGMGDNWIIDCEGITGNTSAGTAPFLLLADGSYVEVKSANSTYGLIIRDFDSDNWIDIDANNMELRNNTGNFSMNIVGDLYLNPGGGQTWATDLRPNIIYDRNNSSYYVDPNGNTRLNRLVQVDNTTMVTNLNADMLDGLHASSFDQSNTNELQDLNSVLSRGNSAGSYDINMNGHRVYNASQIECQSNSSYDKIRVYPSSSYTIGMASGQSFGGYLNDWAMTFTFNNETDRGFLWRDEADAATDGAMALTTDGKLTVKSLIRAPIFYDHNNTGYYLDPASNSRLNTAQLNYLGVGVASNTSYRIYATGAAYGIYAFGSTMGGRFEDTDASARVYCAYGSYDILANGTGRIDATSNIRAPIFYDSNNTSYYGNFASTSTMYKINVYEIDPAYKIGEEYYSIYGGEIIGHRIDVLDEGKLTAGRAEIDLYQQEKGTDLWLFQKAVDLNSLKIMVTANGPAYLYAYQEGSKIIVEAYEGDPECEFTIRLTGTRLDKADQSEKYMNSWRDPEPPTMFIEITNEGKAELRSIPKQDTEDIPEED
ncbi:hypothetical protein JW877_04705, partial [bacterium]|nr:hypothetical protein [bacterium]